jgi:hypothetical protein
MNIFHGLPGDLRESTGLEQAGNISFYPNLWVTI